MIIRIQYILILLISVVFVSCRSGEKNIVISSKAISIQFDNNFDEMIRWLPAGENSIIEFDTLIQSGIVVDGTTCLKFVLNRPDFSKKRITDKEFGNGIEATITGIFEKDDLKIERETRLLLPDKFKNAVIFNTVYRNLGIKKVHIDSVFTQRILVKSRSEKHLSRQADLASFQGGINEWGRDYELIWLTPGFQQENFQGIHHTQQGEFIGGGMPFIDVWDKNMGVAIMHLETKPQWLSLPVYVHQDGRTELGILEKPVEKLGMQEWLNPGDSFRTVTRKHYFSFCLLYQVQNQYGFLSADLHDYENNISLLAGIYRFDLISLYREQRTEVF